MEVISVVVLEVIPVFSKRADIYADIFAAPARLAGTLETLSFIPD